MSLDGYIAKPDGNISFLDQMNQESEDYGYSAFIENVDTVILGRKTYDKLTSMGVETPYDERDVFVLTRNRQNTKGKTIFYSGDLNELINALKSRNGTNIYCDGGAETIQQLLRAQLIDEMVISVVPVLLGEGIRLFDNTYPQQSLKLIGSKSFEKGLVQLHYDMK